MSQESIDILPYIELMKRVFKQILNWFRRNRLLLLIFFVIFIGTEIYQYFFRANYFRTVATIDKETIPEEDILTLFHSISENVNTQYAKVDNEDEALGTIVEFNYSLVINKKDSVLLANMNAEEKSEWRIERAPMQVSLTTTCKTDSIGYYFLDYLNNHKFIKSRRSEEIQGLKNKIKALNMEVSDLDSIKNALIRSNSSKKSGMNNILLGSDESTLYDIVRYRNELSMKLLKAERKLNNLKDDELYIVNKFSNLREVKKDSLTSPVLYIKLLFLTIASTLLITVFRKLFF